jgi:hypothetical protein
MKTKFNENYQENQVGRKRGKKKCGLHMLAVLLSLQESVQY